MPVCERQIVDAMGIGIHPSCSDLVQEGLPQMCRIAIDKLDLRASVLAERFAKPGRERQATCPAADDQDAMNAARGVPSAFIPGSGGSPCAPENVLPNTQRGSAWLFTSLLLRGR